MLTRLAKTLAILSLATSSAVAATFNTNDVDVYNAFAAGATVQSFEGVGGVTPLPISVYTDGLPVPGASHLQAQIGGLHFHSGGASPNDLIGNPGTPVALLALEGAIAGDARSPTNVVAPLKFDTDLLGLAGDFLEIVFATPVNRVGAWLNPGLGGALLTALDADLLTIENVNGSAGNFVGVEIATNSIRAISIVATGAGFTIDDLTYGTTGTTPPPTSVPEPSTLLLLAVALLGLLTLLQQRSRRPV
jgi:hypothetical protein